MTPMRMVHATKTRFLAAWTLALAITMLSCTDMDGSCTYPASEYVDCSGACLVDEDEDGVCDPLEVYGCDIESACNYNNPSH